MRYRLLLLLSVVVACVSLALTGGHLKFRLPHASARASPAQHGFLPRRF